MLSYSARPIPLMAQGQDVCYHRYSSTRAHQGYAEFQGFQCTLHAEVIRQLCGDPARVLATPKQPRAFWLSVLRDCVFTHGQVVFESLLPPQTEDGSCHKAVRTLFQLGGDVIVKVNTQVLTRADSREILEAHMHWTGWCLAQLGQALAPPAIVRRLGWGCLVVGPLCFVGSLSYGGVLPPFGILLTMPAHLLLPSSKLRYFSWGSPGLGALMAIIPFITVGGPLFNIWQISTILLLALQPVAGHGMTWVARKTLHYVIRRQLRLLNS